MTRGGKNHIDSSQGWPSSNFPSVPYSGLARLSERLVHELLQLPSFHQLVQMITQSSTVFDSVPSVLMVLAVKTLITLGWISSHFIRSLEIRFILNLLKDLIHRFLNTELTICVLAIDDWLANSLLVRL